MRVKRVTLRMGRKGEMHEETCDVSALFSLGAATAALGGTREEVQNRLDNAAFGAAPDHGRAG